LKTDLVCSVRFKIFTLHELQAIFTARLRWDSLIQTIKMEISAGETPGMRDACPMDTG
jgi:hypothetical protein